MRFLKDFFERGTTIPLALGATAILALAAIFGIAVVPETNMQISPSHRSVILGDSFEIKVVVDSKVPVNVFAGELHFDHTVLQVASIDYNISIADLWAEIPWYSNGDGILHFGGGTTQRGGFVGNDTLINVTIKAVEEGEGIVYLHGEKIYLHDGLGTNANLKESKNAIFTIEPAPNQTDLIIEPGSKTQYAVVKQPPTTDLNGDGKQSIVDISIFMLNITSDDIRFDFNLDGEVNLADLNLLLTR